MSNALLKLAEIAESQIGRHETGPNTGSDVIRYQRATNLGGTGWAWCAAFVCWCVQELDKLGLADEGLRANELPRTAGAFAFEDWGRRVGAMVWRRDRDSDRPMIPMRGDIIIFTFSHIGICTRTIDARTLRFETVEGNTNKAGEREGTTVLPKERSMSVVRAIIRLPLRAQKA